MDRPCTALPLNHDVTKTWGKTVSGVHMKRLVTDRLFFFCFFGLDLFVCDGRGMQCQTSRARKGEERGGGCEREGADKKERCKKGREEENDSYEPKCV